MSQTTLPPLDNGDRLTRAEFERRYWAMAGDPKAELIDGVVYMPSPARAQHGREHALLTTWLGVYHAATQGCDVLCDATLRLDQDNEPKPDAMLRWREDRGGSSRVDADGYVEGGVELVVEVAASSASYDLHQKRSVYRRHGCGEYLVWVLYERRVVWLRLVEGRYEALAAGDDGVLRSQTFSGLWLDTAALLAGDSAALLATLQRGLVARPS